MAQHTEQNKKAWAKRIAKGLTEKDKKIIKLICQSKTTVEIAEIIGKSKRTVDGNRIAIIKIIGCRGTAGIVLYAVNNNIFKA